MPPLQRAQRLMPLQGSSPVRAEEEMEATRRLQSMLLEIEEMAPRLSKDTLRAAVERMSALIQTASEAPSEAPLSFYSFAGGKPMGISLVDVHSNIVLYEVEANSLAASQGVRAQSVLRQVNGASVEGLGAEKTKAFIGALVNDGQTVRLGVDESRLRV